MRFTSRRDILKMLGSLAALQLSTNIPEAALAGDLLTNKNKSAEDNKKFLTHFHRWYCDTHFNFDKAMNTKEKEYLTSCINGQTQWWKKIDGGVALSTMTYSHRIKNNMVNSSRIGYGSFGNKNDTIQKLGRDICKSRGININNYDEHGSALGLGWDFEEDLFKIYLFEQDISKVSDASIKKLLKTAETLKKYPFGIRSYSFKGGKLIETRAYVALDSKEPLDLIAKNKNVESFKTKIQHTNLMISDQRGLVPQYDLSGPIDDKVFNQSGQKLVAQYKEKFGSHPDTLAYNSQNEFVLYYP